MASSWANGAGRRARRRRGIKRHDTNNMAEIHDPNLWMKIGAPIIAACLWIWKSILQPLSEVQKDLAVIRSNHMAHVEKYAEEIKDLKRREIERDERDHKVIETLARIEERLK